MTVTREQAEHLAVLTAAARPHGAAQWDPPGIVAAIAKVAHVDLAEVMKACARAAQDRTVRTPAVIGDMRSSAWRERLAELASPMKPRICAVHEVQYAGGVCPSCRSHELAAVVPRTVPHGRLAPDDASEVVNDLRDRLAKAQHIDPDPAPSSGVSASQET